MAPEITVPLQNRISGPKQKNNFEAFEKILLKESGPKIWQITICDQQVANTHASTQMATQHGNNHAAIPMRFATADSHKTIELRTQEQT